MNQLSSELKQMIKGTDRLLKLIWAGQFFSLGVYVFLAFRVSSHASESHASPIVHILLALAGGMVGLFFVAHQIFLTPRSIVRYSRQGIIFKLIGMMTPRLVLFPDHSDVVEALTKDEQVLYRYSTSLLQVHLIVWGILHTAALYGMIMSTQSGNLIYCAGCCALVAVIMMMHRPSIEKLLEHGVVELQLGPSR